MPLRVELWVDGRVAEGAEEWWDWVEAVLPADHATRYPHVSRVDAYGDATFAHAELRPLARELEEVSALTRGNTLTFLHKLKDLCERGAAADDAELRFIGD